MFGVSKTASVQMDRTRNSNSVQMDANETKTCDRSANAGEKLAMTEEFKKEVRLENEKKKIKGNKLGADITNGNTVSLQLEAERNRTTNTDRQVAKKAGVGVGT